MRKILLTAALLMLLLLAAAAAVRRRPGTWIRAKREVKLALQWWRERKLEHQRKTQAAMPAPVLPAVPEQPLIAEDPGPEARPAARVPQAAPEWPGFRGSL